MLPSTKDMILEHISLDDLRRLQLTDPEAYGFLTAPADDEPEPELEPEPPPPPKTRSQMTRTEKMEFIRSNGYDNFMALQS